MTRPICALRYLATLALLAGLLLSSTGVLAQDSEGTPVTSDPPTTQEEPPPPPPPPAPEPEVNEPPGLGVNQAPRQSASNTGPDENGDVMQVDDSYSYASPSTLLKVTITPK